MTSAPKAVIHVADGFWNLRASFRIGPLDIGTHASLVRRADGRLVLVDACAFDAATLAWLHEVTAGGELLAAILHVHPFHTMSVRAAHERFPRAKLYGTARHATMFADLPWEPERTESEAFHALHAGDFEFSVPRGVDFIPANPKLHFSSVLVFHPRTRTLHVDDTLLYLRLPWFLGRREILRLHPTLAKVLQPRAGASAEFRVWTTELVERLQRVDNLCAAHSTVLLGTSSSGPSIASRVARAVQRVERTLRAHERRYARG